MGFIMSHGIIAGFDSSLRLAWYSDAKYPLSDALYASARMKDKCTAHIHSWTTGQVHHRRPNLSLQSNTVRN